MRERSMKKYHHHDELTRDYDGLVHPSQVFDQPADVVIDRYVIGRENNVVVVDFRRPDPPTPKFPGAGALRAAGSTVSPTTGVLENHAGPPLLAS
jgi:hypothetical protein